MDRRSFVAGSAAVTAAALTRAPACAQEVYPSRAITVSTRFRREVPPTWWRARSPPCSSRSSSSRW